MTTTAIGAVDGSVEDTAANAGLGFRWGEFSMLTAAVADSSINVFQGRAIIRISPMRVKLEFGLEGQLRRIRRGPPPAESSDRDGRSVRLQRAQLRRNY